MKEIKILSWYSGGYRANSGIQISHHQASCTFNSDVLKLQVEVEETEVISKENGIGET